MILGEDAQCHCVWPRVRKTGTYLINGTPTPVEACVGQFDVIQEVKACGVGNPIYPLTGDKREAIGTGFVVGDSELQLVYDSKARPSTNLWKTNFHKSMTPMPVVAGGTGTYLEVDRGSEGMKSSFVEMSNPCGTLPAYKDGVSSTGSGYQYKAVKEMTLENYDTAGHLITTASISGTTTSTTLSDANTPANVAPAAGYILAVTDNSGRSVNFTYVLPTGADAANGARIKTITDGAGRIITLGYDSQWRVATLTWPDGKVRTFLYEDPVNTWALTGTLDENGSRFATWTYAPTGEALSSEHAGGVGKFEIANKSSYALTYRVREEWVNGNICRYHEVVPPNSITLGKPNGSTAVMASDSSGGILQVAGMSQPAGSGCLASNSASTFDVRGNTVSKNDFNGNRSCFIYDADDQEIVRVEGLPANTDCSTVTNVGATLPAGASRIATQWHPDWKLPTSVTAPGIIQTTVYNGQPDPFNGNAVANCTTAGNLPNGKPLPLVCKTVGQATLTGYVGSSPAYDLNFDNVVLFLRGDGADGSTAAFDSSSSKKTALSVNSGVRLSTVQSKFGGSSIYFDGSVYSFISYTDVPAFSVTTGASTMESWVMLDGAPTATQYIAGQHDQYGGNGSNLMGITAAGKAFGGSFNGSAWPVATSTTTLQPYVWYHLAYVNDASNMYLFVNGKLESTTPKNGIPLYDSTSSFSVGRTGDYNGLNFKGWLDDFRFTNGVARYTADFTAPTTALKGGPIDTSIPVAVATFTYDNAGRVLTATDSLGKTTSYTYYADTTFANGVGHTVGDLYQVTNAAGKSVTVNSYDPSGRVLKMTDANGMVTEMAYAPRGWVTSVSVTPAGGSARVTTYTYDNVGQVTGVTNPDGTTMSMTYDAAHRLVGATDAKGNSVAYTLDNVGNRIAEELKDPSGTLQRTLSRTFDALNRVQQVKLQ